MFIRLAHLTSRHPVSVVIVWVIAAAGFLGLAYGGLGQGGLFDRVHTGAPIVRGSDSNFVQLQDQAAVPTNRGPRLTLEFSVLDLSNPSAISAAIGQAAKQVATRAPVTSVTSPFGVLKGPAFNPSSADLLGASSGGTANPLVATSKNAFLVLVDYAPFPTSDAARIEQNAAIAVFNGALATIRADQPSAELRAYSGPLLFNDFTTQIEKDLVTGETVALPVALVVMVLVFGGFLAASAPIVGALASIAGGLAILFAFSYPIELDQSAINVVTVLGIGLSIDYGLLIVSRFREELLRRSDGMAYDTRADALEATMTSAGRTVFFSGVTVGIAVGGMLLLPPEIMRAFGGAALGVVVMAMLSALTLVPAVIFLMGHRLARPSVLARIPGVRALLRHTADVSRDEGAFSALAAWVQRRPWIVVGGTLALLLVLASPLLQLQVRNSQVELLPTSNERRQLLETFPTRYPSLAQPVIHVLAETTPSNLDEWMTGVSAIGGVARVTAAVDQGGLASAGVFLTTSDAGGPEAVAVVRAMRALDSSFRVYVGGQPAVQVDFVDSIGKGAPEAVGLIVVATFVLLFLMTGSLLVPVKTLIINTLSLAGTLGVVAWIFQQGHLEGLLGFASPGGVETYVLLLIAAFGFGLAMDYEVFLLARIKELVDQDVPNNEAVRIGLQRSGRIITSAATIIVLVFFGFAFGRLLVIKEVGVGLAFAVLLDASVVRMLLVPATMTLLGEWNWWAPGPLRRWHERHGVTH